MLTLKSIVVHVVALFVLVAAATSLSTEIHGQGSGNKPLKPVGPDNPSIPPPRPPIACFKRQLVPVPGATNAWGVVVIGDIVIEGCLVDPPPCLAPVLVRVPC